MVALDLRSVIQEERKRRQAAHLSAATSDCREDASGVQAVDQGPIDLAACSVGADAVEARTCLQPWVAWRLMLPSQVVVKALSVTGCKLTAQRTVQGISYVADFLSVSEEAAVLRSLDQMDQARWVTSGERRIMVHSLAAAMLCLVKAVGEHQQGSPDRDAAAKYICVRVPELWRATRLRVCDGGHACLCLSFSATWKERAGRRLKWMLVAAAAGLLGSSGRTPGRRGRVPGHPRSKPCARQRVLWRSRHPTARRRGPLLAARGHSLAGRAGAALLHPRRAHQRPGCRGALTVVLCLFSFRVPMSFGMLSCSCPCIY